MSQYTTEQGLADLVMTLLEEDREVIYSDDGDEVRPSVRSFHDAGIMSDNTGLVVRFENGAEFQVTFVQSKPGRIGE